MILCPYCLRDFSLSGSPNHSPSLACSHCGQPLPPRYAPDHVSHPPLVCSLVGRRGHGKTVYLCSLLHEFEQAGVRWPGFSYAPLDEEGLQMVREKQRLLEQGHRPEPTRKALPRPVPVRLGPLKDLRSCLLLLYDLAGESLQTAAELKEYAGYLVRSQAITWLVSLRETSPAELQQILVSYLQAATELKGAPRNQKMLLVLTKGDELAGRPATPEAVRQFLNDGQASGWSWSRLEDLSHEIESWLDRCGYRNLLNSLREAFAEVRYCVVSALGPTPFVPPRPVDPRGVLAPLYWLQRFQFPQVELEAPQRRERYLSLAQAVARAPAGAILRLSAGTHRLDEPLVISQPLHLYGEAGKLTCIVGEVAKGVVYYEGNGPLVARNIRFEHQGSAPANVVWLAQGEADFRSCQFTGGVCDPVDRRGGCGLVLDSRTKGIVADCEFRKNAACGIFLLELAGPNLEGNLCEQNRWGIYYAGSTAGTARGNRCLQNIEGGIVVEEWARPRLEENTCQGGEGCGLFVGPRARPTLRRNRFANNKRGDVSDQRSWLQRLLG